MGDKPPSGHGANIGTKSPPPNLACDIKQRRVVSPAGTAVAVPSVNRLVAKSSHPAAYVEVPPEHNEASDLENDPDPGMGGHSSDRSRYNRRRAGSPVVTLLMTEPQPGAASRLRA
jgi:hypothetical protein